MAPLAPGQASSSQQPAVPHPAPPQQAPLPPPFDEQAAQGRLQQLVNGVDRAQGKLQEADQELNRASGQLHAAEARLQGYTASIGTGSGSSGVSGGNGGGSSNGSDGTAGPSPGASNISVNGVRGRGAAAAVPARALPRGAHPAMARHAATQPEAALLAATGPARGLPAGARPAVARHTMQPAAAPAGRLAAAPAAAIRAQPAVTPSPMPAGHVHDGPVCDKCLQPIDLDLFARCVQPFGALGSAQLWPLCSPVEVADRITLDVDLAAVPWPSAHCRRLPQAGSFLPAPLASH